MVFLSLAVLSFLAVFVLSVPVDRYCTSWDTAAGGSSPSHFRSDIDWIESGTIYQVCLCNLGKKAEIDETHFISLENLLFLCPYLFSR